MFKVSRSIKIRLQRIYINMSKPVSDIRRKKLQKMTYLHIQVSIFKLLYKNVTSKRQRLFSRESRLRHFRSSSLERFLLVWTVRLTIEIKLRFKCLRRWVDTALAAGLFGDQARVELVNYLRSRPRDKKLDFFQDFLSIKKFLEILRTFRKKWDLGGFLDDLEQKLFYILCRFI